MGEIRRGGEGPDLLALTNRIIERSGLCTGVDLDAALKKIAATKNVAVKEQLLRAIDAGLDAGSGEYAAAVKAAIEHQ